MRWAKKEKRNVRNAIGDNKRMKPMTKWYAGVSAAWQGLCGQSFPIKTHG